MSTSSPTLPLVTERLRLRPYEPADVAWLYRVYSQPDVARFLLEEPWSADDAARQIEERVGKDDLDGEVGALSLVVEHERDAIGDISLWFTDRERRVAEIGWVIDPARSGRGFATEAVRAVLALAFDHYGLHRVAAQMDARNIASAKLATNAGMRHEANLRQSWWSKGEWTDNVIFGMLAADRG